MYSENEIPELEGTFKINKKHCFFCNKLVDIYFILTKDKLYFYSNKEKTKIYRLISRNLVLAINRRLRTENDKNKLSIYYLENENSNIIKEFKLKADNRFEMEKWISNLTKKIKPKRFVYTNTNDNYVLANDIFNFKNKSDFYVSLCNLEYILLKNKMRKFFEIYNDKNDYSNNENLNEDDSIILD